MFSKPIPEHENYYTSFLQKIREEKSGEENTSPLLSISYADFFSKKINLEKYKLPDLKYLAKHHKLLISGNKPIIIERLKTHFKRHKMCERIQSVFRRHLVLYGKRLRGEGYPDCSKCVNDTDFYTLDPLKEIPDERFFSFQDEKNFIYGFDILSLIFMIKSTSLPQKVNILNPYNREKFSNNTLKNIISFYSIFLILYPQKGISANIFSPIQNNPSIFHSRPNNIRPPSAVRISLTERIRQWDTREEQSRNIIREIREDKTIDYRINQLFYEIDNLGNYSSPEWFTGLSVESYKSLYETCYQWWRRPNHIPIHVKNAICGIYDPFREIYLIRNTSDREEAKEIMLNIFEILIFTGVDIEHRTLGALHVLTMLTTVSADARSTLPWLFESIR